MWCYEHARKRREPHRRRRHDIVREINEKWQARFAMLKAWTCKNQLVMHMGTKIADFLFVYHNVAKYYLCQHNKTFIIMHNLMAILLQLTETGNPFRTKNIATT